MAGKKNAYSWGANLTKQEQWKQCEKQYGGFLLYRNDITTGGMPDFRRNLFAARAFDGTHFEMAHE